MARAEEHIRELLKLPVEERAHAAKLLLDSLYPDEPDADAEEAQGAEIVRRLQRLDDGTAHLIGGADARLRILARLREIRGE